MNLSKLPQSWHSGSLEHKHLVRETNERRCSSLGGSWITMEWRAGSFCLQRIEGWPIYSSEPHPVRMFNKNWCPFFEVDNEGFGVAQFAGDGTPYVWLWRFQNAASSSFFSVVREEFHRSDSSHMSDPLISRAVLRAFKTSSSIRGRSPSATRCAFVSRMSTARLSASRRIFLASFPVHSRQRGSSHLQPCMYSGRGGLSSFTGQGFHIDLLDPSNLVRVSQFDAAGSGRGLAPILPQGPTQHLVGRAVKGGPFIVSLSGRPRLGPQPWAA